MNNLPAGLRIFNKAQGVTAPVQDENWYRIKARGEADQAVIEVYVYGEIGAWGITANQFIQDLRAVDDGTSPVVVAFNTIGGDLTITVPPLGAVVYRATRPVAPSTAAPGIEITSPAHSDVVPLGTTMMDGHAVIDRVEVAAELDSTAYAEVTFAVRVGDGEWTPIGTDDNAPYRVFYDATALRDTPETPLAFRAIVNDVNGHLAADQVSNVAVEFPSPTGPAIRRRCAASWSRTPRASTVSPSARIEEM